MKTALEKIAETMKVDCVDGETARVPDKIAVPRISTNRINLWICQLEMKRRVVSE